MAGSGNFQGHAIPAVFFFGFGMFFLLLSLRRSRTLNNDKRSSDSSFAQAYLPERNLRLIKRVGLIVVGSAIVGILVEAIGGCIDSRWDGYSFPQCFLHQQAHEILYLTYGSVGIAMWLESKQLLPLDSSRSMLALSSLCGYILWHEHALMKTDMVDHRVHELQALSCLAQAVILLYSISIRPQSVLAYLMGWASMVQQSLWLMTAGYNTIVSLSMHAIAPLFCLQIVVVAMGVTVTAALCSGANYTNDNPLATRANGLHRNSSIDSPDGVSEYEQLRITNHDDEDVVELV